MSDFNDPYAEAAIADPYESAITSPPAMGHENFLQKAIKNSRVGPFGGTSITAILPTSGQEAMDAARVAGRQIPMTRGQGVGPAEMGPMGIGLNMAGINEAKPLIPEPETEYGKNLEMSADIAPWAAMGLGGATAAAKGIHKFFSKGDLPNELATGQEFSSALGSENQRLNKIQEYIGKRASREVGYAEGKTSEEISRLKNKGKQLKTQYGDKVRGLAYQGSEDIQSQVGQKFKSAREQYNSMLDSQEMGKLTNSDLLDPLEKTIANKGVESKQGIFRDGSENHLLSMRDKIASKIIPAGEDSVDPITNQVIKGTPKQSPELENITDIKDYKNKILKGLEGRPDLEAEFMKNYREFLKSKGLDDFAGASIPYQDAYSALDASKELGETTLRQAGTNMPENKLSDLLNQERKVGTNYLNQIRSEKTKNASSQKELSNQISQVEKNLEKIVQDIKTKYAGAKSKVGEYSKGNEEKLADLEAGLKMVQGQLDTIMGRRKVIKGTGVAALSGAGGYGGYKVARGIFDLFGQNQENK